MNNVACPLLHFFCVSLLLLMLYAAVVDVADAAVVAFCRSIFASFRLRVEMLSDHSLFLLYPHQCGVLCAVIAWVFECLKVQICTQFITDLVNKFIYYTCDTLFVCTLYYTLDESISTHKLFKEFMSIDASISKMNENKIARTILLACTMIFIVCFRYKSNWKFACDLLFNRMPLKVMSVSIEFRLFSFLFFFIDRPTSNYDN